MAGQLLLINPRRRRRAKKSHRRARRSRRKMTALQMKYFGGGRAHRNPSRKRRARRRGRSSYRAYSRRARRSASRIGRSMGFSLPAITSSMKTAAIGASGAVAVDVLMGQANKFLPADWQSRLDSAGSVNWKYYLAKGALAIGLGVAGARFGGRYRGAVLTMAQGSLMVQAYEIMREFVPSDILPLGYYTSGRVSMPGTPGNVVGMGKYLPRAGASLRGMGVINNRQERIR